MAGRKGNKKDDSSAAIDVDYNGAFKVEVMDAVNKAIKTAMDILKKDLTDIYNRKYEELLHRVIAQEGETSLLKSAVTALQKDLSDYKLAHPAPPVVWPSQVTASGEQSKSMLAAVHVEFADKQRRRSNVIVSGLKPCEGFSDPELFLQLCEENLSSKPSIRNDRCRRLGKVQPGKIQPLLVALTSEDAATELLGCSSQLRKSNDVLVRSTVYINADLTPAEALAAWELRSKRRERKARSEQQIADGNAVSSENPLLHADTNSKLSVSAPAFVAGPGNVAASF
jgi:hypothetical protein